MQRLWPLTVAQGDSTELDIAARRNEVGLRLWAVRDGWSGVEDLLDTTHRGGALLEEVDSPTKRDHREGERGEIGVELDKLTQLDASRDHIGATQPEQ